MLHRNRREKTLLHVIYKQYRNYFGLPEDRQLKLDIFSGRLQEQPELLPLYLKKVIMLVCTRLFY